MTLESRLRTALDEGNIERVFRIELLWDRPHGIAPVELANGQVPYEVRAVAAKKNFVVFECDNIPPIEDRVRIERSVARRAIENLIVYKGANGDRKIVWTEARPGRAPHPYVHHYIGGVPNADLLQRLAQLRFNLADHASLNLVTVRARVQQALAADRVTKAFYDTFSKQHRALCTSIENIPDDEHRSWYSSVLLNRLMFLYFMQRKGFLDDNRTYLSDRLDRVRALRGPDKFFTFFRRFLLPLFHTSLAARDAEPDDPEIASLVGDVPHLNGGMFARHELEVRYQDVDVPDSAFQGIFRFFDSWKWTLDERETASGNEINPDILGYIFERYINQKQMGAYYTKEDVTGYMTAGALLPWFLDRLTARLHEQGIEYNPYDRLKNSGDRYLYAAPLTGVDAKLTPGFPSTVAAMAFTDSAAEPASPQVGLPGESWLECLDRIQTQRTLRERINSGEIRTSNDAVTANLNLIALVTDLLRDCEQPEVLDVAYVVLTDMSVLDPACGSGAFLFAALDLLVVLKRTCVESMEQFLREQRGSLPACISERFERVLHNIARHPSRDYFLHKSVALDNLYGVDIMPEAVEIAKLRLFLNLIRHIGVRAQLEPLPDLDFNLRAGNSLVGFATEQHVTEALSATLDSGDALATVLNLTRQAGSAYERFLGEQIDPDSSEDVSGLKAVVEAALLNVRKALNNALAADYGIGSVQEAKWEQDATPFHWFTEFYPIMHRGGFDVVVGNPPYVAKGKVDYKVVGLKTAGTPDIYAPMTERAATLCAPAGRLGMILPISAQFSEDFRALREYLTGRFPQRWVSTFSRNPAALFEAGLGVRSSIIVAGPGDETRTLTTRTHRWVEGYRPALFESLRYTSMPGDVIAATDSWPRAHSPATAAMTAAMLESCPSRLTTAVRRRGEHQVGMKSIGLYWISCYSTEPPSYTLAGEPIPHTAVRGIAFEDENYRDAALAVLASKSALYWWATNGDDFNVTGGLLIRVPVDLHRLGLEDREALSEIGRDLAAALPEHVQYTKYAGKWMGNYVLPELRHITDRADAILARALGYVDSIADLEAFYWSFYKPTGERPGTLRERPIFV